MGTDLYWEDERRVPLDEVDDGLNLFIGAVMSAQLGGTTCLRFVDPYGDTTFNQGQIPVLIDETERLYASVKDPSARDQIARMLTLMRKSKRVHTYLRFVGD